MAAAKQLLLTCLLAGSCCSVRSVLLGSGSAVRQTPTSYYVPFQTVGADYLQAGDKRATFQYNNPFQKTGCDNPAAGFNGVTAITTYGFPVLKISVEFEGGGSAVVGDCKDFCYATRIDFTPGELITGLALYDFSDKTNSTYWSAFGGMRINTTGPGGNRTVNLGYSGVTPWTVGTPYEVDVGSGFVCGVYGFTVDTGFPSQALQATDTSLMKGSVIAAGLAFIKSVKGVHLNNMRFPSVAGLSVPGTTVKSQRFSLTNSAKQQASFSPHASIPYQYTQNWASPSRAQAAFATLPFRAAGNSSSGDGSDDGGMVDITVAELSEVGFSGNSSSNWLVWPKHVSTTSYEIDNIGTIYNTQTYTFSADFTLIAPASSGVTYDIQLNAGQFSTPYVADLLLDLSDAEGTLNVTMRGTFDGFIIQGAAATIRAPQPLMAAPPSQQPMVASGGGGAGGNGTTPYVSQREQPAPPVYSSDAPCPVYLGDKSVTVVAQLPVATVSVVGTSFLVQSKCIKLLYPFTLASSNYSELVR